MRQLLKRKLDAVCGKAREIKTLGDGLGLNENLFTMQIHITPSPRLHKAIVGLGMEGFFADFECHMEVPNTGSSHDSGQAGAQTSEQGGVRTDEDGEHQGHMVDYRCEQMAEEPCESQEEAFTSSLPMAEASVAEASVAEESLLPMAESSHVMCRGSQKL